MKKLILTLLILSLQTVVTAESPSDAFSSYKSAILAQDGKGASKRVTKSTLDEYSNYLKWAKTSTKEELKQLSFMNRFQVILIKHRVPKELLLKMNGTELFEYAVDHDWIGKASVISTTTKNFIEYEERAISDVYASGQKAPYKFQYKKEGGIWKFDLTAIIQATNETLRQMALQSGMTEDEFIFRITESASGQQVPDSIWEPLLKD